MQLFYRILVLLLAALMVAPTNAEAHQFSLGLGYVDGDCGVLAETESKRCFRGGRFEFLWNFFTAQPSANGGSSDRVSSSSSSRSSWYHHTNFGSFGSGGRGDFIVLAFLLTLLIVAGIFWAVVYLFSSRTKLGIYYSSDLQEMPIIANGDQEGIETYRIDKLGTQISFYPVNAFDFQLYFGFAGAAGRIKTIEDDGSVISLRLRGFASKAGLGYMPDMGKSGPLLLGEVEGAFYSGSAIEYSEETRKRGIPKVRSNAAFMIGYAFSF